MSEFLSNFDMTTRLIIAGFTIMGLVYRYSWRPRIENLIYQRTAQIQPDSNGGESLRDVAIALGRLEGTIEQIDKRLGNLENNLGRRSR